MSNELTQGELMKILKYNPETGIFTSVKKGIVIGYKVGSKRKFYLGTEIKTKQYKLHRLAWLYCHGVHPINMIDHIDGNGFNNSINNLRDISNSENMQNQKKAMSTNKSSGFLGVYGIKNSDKFRAIITINGASKHLGYFKSALEASEAYLAEKRLIHSTCTI
jgi:hypothetical protein